MDRFFRRVKYTLIFAICLTILFIASIPVVIVSALHVDSMLYVLIIAAAILIGGFYGLPFVWINYHILVIRKQILELAKQGVLDTRSIAESLDIKENYIIKQVTKLVLGDYISADLITRTPDFVKQEKSNPEAVICSGCGVAYKKKNEHSVCPYCGRFN